jgi:hypothetical protein
MNDALVTVVILAMFVLIGVFVWWNGSYAPTRTREASEMLSRRDYGGCMGASVRLFLTAALLLAAAVAVGVLNTSVSGGVP